MSRVSRGAQNVLGSDTYLQANVSPCRMGGPQKWQGKMGVVTWRGIVSEDGFEGHGRIIVCE